MTKLKNTCMNIVIPMAGQGSRFSSQGYAIPKPLISVLGIPMIEWAVKSFDFLNRVPEYRIIFIVLKEHIDNYKIDQILTKLFDKNKITIIMLESPTNGQAQTVLAAKNLINNKNKLIIYNCDTYSISPIWDLIESEDPDGILPCFVSNNPSLSYVQLNNEGYATVVKEKEVISDLATTGMYYFKHGKDFIASVENSIKQNKNTIKEIYVAPCYNKLINNGLRVKIVTASTNWVLGTPEDLMFFLYNYEK